MTASPPVKRGPPTRKKSVEFYVLGLDPSLRHSGCVILDSLGAVVQQFTVDNPAPKPKEPRAWSADINLAIKPLLQARLSLLSTNKPVVMVREDYAYAAASGSDAILKELGGVLRWEIEKASIGGLLYDLGIQQAKKWATDNGNAEKEKVIAGVKKRFSFEGDEHQCDAYAVASLALELLRPGSYTPLSAAQKELLAGLREHELTQLKFGAP